MKTVTNTTNPDQSGPGSNDTEEYSTLLRAPELTLPSDEV